MKILIIGGTRFVGRHLVEELIGRRHDLTMLNRGNNNIFPQLKTITGDRNDQSRIDLAAGQKWDAVIDTCAYFPRQVRMLANVLRSAAHYVLISSISAYQNQGTANLCENDALAVISEDTPEQITETTYGGFKVLCEKAAAELSAAPLIIRPGLIVGPHDPTDRFTYWPQRILQGERVLVPDCPRSPLQFIDARDLAVFIADAIEKRCTGPYNLVNSPGEYCFADLLEACYRVSGSKAVKTMVPEEFLLKNGVEPWGDLPFWSPGPSGNFMLTSNRKAVTDGLKTRPLAETVRDICSWLADEKKNTLKAGMTAAREAQLLQAWDATSPTPK